METKEWFTDWFNTPYYHILYKDRNDTDAQLFMKNITTFLALPKDTHILDLPCGKGRHSVYLNSLGYTVTGYDLASQSIAEAKVFENDTLHFKVHDMRKSLHNSYGAIFNLFTSFGYFKEDEEDLLILKNIKKGLNKGGYFVFDFLNVDLIKRNLVAAETKTIDGITFEISRKIEDNFIIKTIKFFADNEYKKYTERVKFLDETKLKSYFSKVGFTIENTFGDYHLNSFENKTSNRLILIAK